MTPPKRPRIKWKYATNNKGMTCPECGCWDSHVYYTRHPRGKGMEIIRHHICRNCKASFISKQEIV